jgi:hypothetical protein
MNTIVDVLLSDVEKSISNFGTGWNTALSMRVFYRLKKDAQTGQAWGSAFKSRLAVIAPNAQPAVTVVPATAIGAHAEGIVGVCIQAVK